MAIWTRRALQGMLLNTTAFTSLEQRQRWAAAIDRGDEKSLDFEWEIAVLHALACAGSLEHEPVLNGTKPDIRFVGPTGSAADTFVADVATVHETGLHTENPIEAFTRELQRRATKIGLRASFDVRVGGEMMGEPASRVMRLKLPPESGFPRFFKAIVDPFLRECRAQPSEPRTLVTRDDAISVEITYRMGDGSLSVGYPSFTTAYSVRRNPVYNALKRKAQQLGKSRFVGPRGVVLCGADASLHERGADNRFGTEAIIKNVLRQYTGLTFVLTLWTTQPWSEQEGTVRAVLHVNDRPTHPLSSYTRHVLTTLGSWMPAPVNDGKNAVYELRVPRFRRGRTLFGNFRMTPNEIRISVRTLMELLAGRIALSDFLARHGGDQGLVPLFEQKLRAGQLLAGAEIVPSLGRDDDWIVFRFGPPSPAGGPMRAE